MKEKDIRTFRRIQGYVPCKFKNWQKKRCRITSYCKYWESCEEEGIKEFAYRHDLHELRRLY